MRPLLKEKKTHSDYKIEISTINQRPGIIISKKLDSGLWEFETLIGFEFQDEKMARIYAQRNPDKLKTLYKEALFTRN